MAGNPFPEDFAPGKYTHYVPIDGDKAVEIFTASNEEQIITKFNELETKGFNMNINPRYGWERDKDNNLSISKEKISCTSFDNALTRQIDLHEDKVSIEELRQDANNLYNLLAIQSAVSLQKTSGSNPVSRQTKQDTLSAISKLKEKSENAYFNKYGKIPPTVEVLLDQEHKQKIITRIENKDHQEPQIQVQEAAIDETALANSIAHSIKNRFCAQENDRKSYASGNNVKNKQATR